MKFILKGTNRLLINYKKHCYNTLNKSMLDVDFIFLCYILSKRHYFLVEDNTRLCSGDGEGGRNFISFPNLKTIES